jgi:hypothetical protein
MNVGRGPAVNLETTLTVGGSAFEPYRIYGWRTADVFVDNDGSQHDTEESNWAPTPRYWEQVMIMKQNQELEFGLRPGASMSILENFDSQAACLALVTVKFEDAYGNRFQAKRGLVPTQSGTRNGSIQVPASGLTCYQVSPF